MIIEQANIQLNTLVTIADSRYKYERMEIQVIAEIIINNQLYVKNKHNISIDLFTNNTCKEIIKFFENNYQSMITSEELYEKELITNDFYEYVLNTLSVAEEIFLSWIKSLASLRARRELLETITNILPKNLNNEDLEATANELMVKINNIIRKSNTTKNNLLIDNEKFIDLLQKNITEELEQLPIGYADIDNKYKISRNNLVVIGANTGIGKTWLGLNIYDYANTHGYNAIFFTTEMSDRQIVNRLAQVYTGSDLNGFKPTYNDFDVIMARIHQSRHNIINIERLTLSDVRRYLIEMKNTKGNVDYVFIDYLTRMEMPNIYKDYRLNVAYVAKELKTMCKEFNCVIFLLAQASRDNLKRMDKRLTIADLAESANIEREADSIILLYSEEEVRSHVKKPIPAGIKSILEVSVAKNRHGKKINDVLQISNGKISLVAPMAKIDYFNELKNKG